MYKTMARGKRKCNTTRSDRLILFIILNSLDIFYKMFLASCKARIILYMDAFILGGYTCN